MAVTRTNVIEALKILGIDPQMTDEVTIFTDKIIVRRRDILIIENDPEQTGEVPHTH